MKLSIALLLLAGIILFAVACNKKTPEKLTTTEKPAPDVALADTTATWHPPVANRNTKSDKEVYSYLMYKKTPCFGKCPIYEANFYTDGKVTYHGKNFVDKVGHFESRISEAEKQRIRQAFFDANFLEMAHEYPVGGHKVVDLPTTVIEFRVGDMIKHCTNRSQAPRELMELQKMVERTLDELPWMQVEVNQEGK